jgi:O-antigen/teichoic acid export membrane protein
MIKKVSNSELLWAYSAQFLNVGSGIILIPIAIMFLSTEDLGLWYLFIAISSLAQLLEFGFQPTISRMTSYIYSGANELVAEGLPKKGSSISYQLLFDLIQASKLLYGYISVFAAVVLFILGTFYLNTFDAFGEDQYYSWLLFAFSIIVNLYFTYMNGLMTGRGSQLELYKYMAISKFVMVIIAIPFLISGFGLYSMALSMIISTAVNRFLIYKSFYDVSRDDMLIVSGIEKINCRYIYIVWLSAWKLGLTSVGAFLILRANQFIASSFLGLKVAASYGLTVQIFSILTTVSSMYFNLNMPKMTALQSEGSKKELKSIFNRSVLYTNLLFFLASVFVVLFGSQILDLLSVNTSILPTTIIIVMIIMYQLEVNHTVNATYLTTYNKVPFMYSALVSGIMITIISLLMVSQTKLGIFGIVLSQLLVQLAYNNWYWPLAAYRDLRNE